MRFRYKALVLQSVKQFSILVASGLEQETYHGVDDMAVLNVSLHNRAEVRRVRETLLMQKHNS